ncbi:MAG: Gfo/Idh/MocA family oxidoreductase [Lachnospiraceae bacterium]
MKIGILGAGGIAKKMADTIYAIEGVESYAIGAREYEKAKKFADENGFTKAYGSYEALVSDPEIDLIYIATPHSHHYEHMKMCLNHKKNVLCEKAFTVNAEQAIEVIALAERKKLFLAEALWTRYMPMRQTINEVIKSGMIGEVTSIVANLGYAIDHIPRIQNSALAGGALLDLSVYVINFASMILGNDIKKICATATMTDKGVDSQDSIVITYPDGKMAMFYTTTLSSTDREGVINGRNGYIKIDNINNYEKIRVFNNEQELIQTIHAPEQITGYEYEILAAKKALEEGKTECIEMPHQETIHMMEVLDGIRAQWGMKYTCEW